MKTYAVKRLLQGFITVIGAMTVVFLMVRLVPGDPVATLLGDYYTEEAAQVLRSEFGLHQPIYVQYFNYLTDAFQGDFGYSFVTGRPVYNTLVEAFPFTMELAIASLVFALTIGVPVGVMAALNRNSWIDMLSMAFAIAFISIPGFYLGVLLLQYFSLGLGWFPVTGVGGPELADRLRHLVLPAIALGAPTAAISARMTRSSVVEVMGEDYIRTARSKGIHERIVVFKHALRNAMIPVVAIIGLSVAVRFGGSVVIETVFARRGVGYLLIQSIYDRDFVQVQFGILFYACVLVLVNIICDLSYAGLDPRIRYN